MSEAVPLPAATQRPAEAAPVMPAQQPGERQEAGQQGQASQSAQPANSAPAAAPTFKEPAISLSPHLAGIKVGDVVSGTVERIDSEVRAVVQNTRQTVLVDPAAHLKPSQKIEITITQTAPQFLGSIAAPKQSAPPVPVQLALVALRGVDLPAASLAPAATTRALPAALPQAAAPLNSAQDIASALVAAPKQVALPQAAAPAAPVLLQASIALPKQSELPAQVFQTFIERHPGLSASPKPIVLTLLPASPNSFAYPKPPAATSPVGQLIRHGRALIVDVERPAAKPLESIVKAQPPSTVTVRAGPLRITLPNLPDTPIKPGDRLVVLSADAAPKTRKSIDVDPSRTSATSVRPVAISKAAQELAAPSLAPVFIPLQALPQLQTLPIMGRLSQLIAYSLLQSDTAVTLRGSIEDSAPAPKQAALEPDRQGIKQTNQKTERLRGLMDALAPVRKDAGLLVPSAAGASNMAETPALPLVIAGGDTPLIASLFHLVGHGKAQDGDNDSDQRRDQDTKERTFEVAIDFQRFGKTTLSGRVSPRELFISMRSEHALPRNLRDDLKSVFSDRCAACGLEGAIAFKTGHPASQTA
ncbi:MAG: hypothetical protein AAF221_02350 [Pseudomonadota bacterium]